MITTKHAIDLLQKQSGNVSIAYCKHSIIRQLEIMAYAHKCFYSFQPQKIFNQFIDSTLLINIANRYSEVTKLEISAARDQFFYLQSS